MQLALYDCGKVTGLDIHILQI